jgi:hypothetical protein
LKFREILGVGDLLDYHLNLTNTRHVEDTAARVTFRKNRSTEFDIIAIMNDAEVT